MQFFHSSPFVVYTHSVHHTEQEQTVDWQQALEHHWPLGCYSRSSCGWCGSAGVCHPHASESIGYTANRSNSLQKHKQKSD